MSEENLAKARAIAQAFDERDEAAWLALCDRDVEFLDKLSLNPNVYRGRDAASAWFRGWEKVWEDINVPMAEIIRDEDDVVIWRSSARARGKMSGAEVAQDFWTFGRLRENLFVRIEVHRSEADALEAAGLSE